MSNGGMGLALWDYLISRHIIFITDSRGVTLALLIIYMQQEVGEYKWLVEVTKSFNMQWFISVIMVSGS